MRSFTIYTLRHISSGWLYPGEWNRRHIQHAWEKQEIHLTRNKVWGCGLDL